MYGFTAMCFSCMAYSMHAQCCIGPRACCSSKVSCVSNLSYCYGDKFVVRGVLVPAEGPTTLQLQHVAQSYTVTEKVRSHD